MNTKISEKTRKQIYNAVPADRWATPGEIWDGVGNWGPTTIRHALRDMHEAGWIRRQGPPRHYQFRRPS